MLTEARNLQAISGSPEAQPQTAAKTEAAAITLNNCSLSFGSTRVLDKVSLEVRKGEFLSILGPSGCGKSTILRLMLGLLKPDEGGSITHSPDSLNIGMVFQKPVLMPWLTSMQNIELPLSI